MPQEDSGTKGTNAVLESLISYSGEADTPEILFDLALFRKLNEEYREKPVVPAPRAHATSYTSGIGAKRAEMLERKIGISGLRVLELGCGDGMLSRVLATDCGCEVVGVDIQPYESWTRPVEGKLTQLVHDVTTADNGTLGTFDRVVSFAVMEHVVHPTGALQAIYDMLRPGGKAYIYANLYRGAKASHRYREVFFPWPHLLFEQPVWRAFYLDLMGEPLQAAWVNKLTYDQYLGIAGRIGFTVKEHFPSAPYFDEEFYRRFEYRLAAYPKFDLMHDFIHLVLEKPRTEAPGGEFPSTETAALSRTAVTDLRHTLAAAPRRSYDRISYVKWDPIDPEAIMAGNPFHVLNFEFTIGETIDWNDKSAPRSKQLFSHSWDHLEPLFVSHSETNNPKILGFLIENALIWIDAFGAKPLKRPKSMSVNEADEPEEEFLSADTAIGNRFYRLAYLVAAAAHDRAVGEEVFAELVEALAAHGHALAQQGNFSSQHNHGILQAIAQICGASRMTATSGAPLLPGMAEAYEQGRQRLLAMLAEHVGADGVHKEHSPAYHTLLVAALDWIVVNGIVEDPALRDLVDRMGAAARWMYGPDDRIVALGDSDPALDVLGAERARAGTSAPEDGQALFPDGGYWFVKAGTAHGTTYLAQSCAFHSRFHKQADSGTFVWHDRGADILIDAGRYGYLGRTEPGSPLFLDGFWYSDPKRVHVEGTRAHNAIEIDGRNHRRYRQQPSGGTITGSLEKDGVFASRSTVPNAGPGQNQRFLLLRPGEWLAVIDTCRFSDRPRAVRQWFNLHPGWAVESREDRLLLSQSGQTISVLSPLSDTGFTAVFSGETHAPRDALDSGYTGWWSPAAGEFEPCSSFSTSKTGDFVTLATLFVFGDVAAKRCRATHNVTHRVIKLAWNDGEKRRNLALTSPGIAHNEFDLAYTGD